MMRKKSFNIVVEGCCHGELDSIYEAIGKLNKPVDLVLICGDFQALRNEQDMNCIAMPPKYRKLGDFHKYYTGEKKAPYLTLFIGGNHESSNYLWELFYGGWAAPNIYYMGAASVVNFNGLKIGGLSGIYNHQHFHWHHLEKLPYNGSSERSVYHVRKFDTMKLLMLRQGLNVMMSHDWPARIEHFGDLKKLLRFKKHLARDVDTGRLGSPAAGSILQNVRPDYWFSAHLHVRYEALVKHEPHEEIVNETKNATKLIEEESKNEDEIDLEELLDETDNDKKNEDEIELEGLLDETANDNEANKSNVLHAKEETFQKEALNSDEIDLSSELSLEPSTDQPVKSEAPNNVNKVGAPETHFLALDKCLPGRRFIEHITIEVETRPEKRKRRPSTLDDGDSAQVTEEETGLSYDPEWLAITRAFHKYFKTSSNQTVDELPHVNDIDSLNEHISTELQWVNENIVDKDLLTIPNNFKVQTETPAAPTSSWKNQQPPEIRNNQTEDFCRLLELDNRIYHL
ncbi:Dbr1p [Sugiyamaella lignohabitans]|uniref:Dbr1p n=1 Tax=Sugiyamaella lignohabitans TaxID=796027 RepID=A0A167E851_9ASCO|nr:Dbr1p [Sugiyamaella lignohabitans]ANB13758.1 Dbr1p [Sugiyamaella lignohabitans]